MAIRVLVVDDSVLFRTKLQLSLSEDKDIIVVGCAINAIDAKELIDKLNPDVITLDIEMPQINGIDFLKELIPKKPIPVVVVSSLPMNALDALNAGAVEFVKKPAIGQINAVKYFMDGLKQKIKIASTATVHRSGSPSESLTSMLAPKITAHKNSIIAIGASTGGTEAILNVVKNLPPSTPGIIITQHMPATFTDLYAQRLNKICKMSAKEAVDLDRVEAGQILVAAGEYHLTLKKDTRGYYVRSTQGAKVSGHCPSVDVMFDSVAQVAGANAIAVILTGMGADGARGITKIRQMGGYTIGQDKESCVVYGMPMEAFKLGGIVRQLPLDQISGEVIYHFNKLSKTALK